jgi:cytosine/adenosine deaminase-related metal-dependent hydrolase
MVLHNLHIVNGQHVASIDIQGNRIAGLNNELAQENHPRLHLTFDKVLAFPGLINSHDHLDFNLFPQLGDRKYESYREWGPYIHQKYADEIAAVLKTPMSLREDWGMVKNLLCGVTTVVNHGEKLQTPNRLIHIHDHCQNLHSIGFEKLWRLKLNNPFKRALPVVIHTGEGIDHQAYKEIDQLTKWNLLQRKLIGIHGVAMSSRQAKKFRAFVWCPQSNDFLLGKTAQVAILAKDTHVLFGTDSTLTGNWDIWQHIRYARQLQLLNDEELYNSLNTTATHTWKLPCGKIKKGRRADIVITRNKNYQNDLEGYFLTTPKEILLVLNNGNTMLFDEELLPQMAETDLSAFSKVYIQGTCKYIRFDVPKLIREIKQYYPAATFPIET